MSDGFDLPTTARLVAMKEGGWVVAWHLYSPLS